MTKKKYVVPLKEAITGVSARPGGDVPHPDR